MAKISKRQIKEINRISFIHDVIKEQYTDNDRLIGGTHWVDTPPDMWNNQERELYDILIALESKIKDEVLRIVGGENI